jgi:acetolactate synthase small subunit
MLLTEQYVGKTLEEIAPMLAAAGYKIRVVTEGVPCSLTENKDLGRATIEVTGGKVVNIIIG